MKIKTLLPLTVAIASLSIVACNGSRQKEKINEDAVGYQYEDPNKPIVNENSGVSFEVLAPKNAMARNYSEMKVFQDLQAATNVEIDFENLSESSYSERKNTIMADKENWPDAIYHAGFNDKELVNYHKRKVIIDFKDYLQYMPNFRGILDRRPDIRKAITSADGGIYSLPRIEEMGLKPYPNLLFLNKAFATKLINDGNIDGVTCYGEGSSQHVMTVADLKDGLKMSRANYKKLIKAFKTKNVNGQGNVIPLNFVYGNWQGNQSDLFASFGIPENVDHKTIIDNQITWTCDTDKFKGAINELAGWVTDGIIEKTAFEQTQDNFLASGKAAVQKLGSFYWWESATVVSDPENFICMQPLVDDTTGKQYVGLANNQEIEKGEIVVFANGSSPKILSTYFDRFYNPITSAELNYGPRGLVFEEELQDGKLVYKDLSGTGKTADEIRLKDAPMGAVGLTKDVWGTVVDMEERAQLRLNRLNQYAVPFVYQGAKQIPNITYTASEINQLSNIEISLAGYIDASIQDWLIHGGVTDAKWNAYKSQLKTIGYETVKSINQAGYDRYLAS